MPFSEIPEKKNFMSNHVKIPMLTMRGISVFPENIQAFECERKASVAAVRAAAESDRLVFVTSQTDPAIDIPEEKDIYRYGIVCVIRQQIQQKNLEYCRVMVEGKYRAYAEEFYLDNKNGHYATVIPLEDAEERISENRKEALIHNATSLFEEYLQLTDRFIPEQVLALYSSTSESFISNFIAQNTDLPIEDKQDLIEELRPCKRLEMLCRLIRHEISVLNIEKEISEATQESIDKEQREYYLRQQMKAIQTELGDESYSDDTENYKKRIASLEASDEVKQKLKKELSHLLKQQPGSPDAAVSRTYLDTCLDLPWNVFTKETLSVEHARRVLDREHYGLEKVKERILEYIAVRQLAPDVKGGLICLVGFPGTGKTSVAMSVAKATNRKLVRISLGGVHDEADIRGHRKTYIGAMPGRIINGLIQAGSMNPVMVLDEIDKLGSDYHGDPAAALLEALDPEQNSTFRDHFLEIPFDLSNILFITTANTTETIPPALLDRMEVIELPSYTDEEKLQIAKKHLIPKQRKKHGLTGNQLKISDNAIRGIITGYTREAGVRVLEREIASLCRKAACGIAEEKYSACSVSENTLEEMLGPQKFKPDEKRLSAEPGLVRGLAWTSVGGEVLDVEVAVNEGSGKLEITGNLGDVMKESARAAVTCIRSRASSLGIDSEFYKNKDIHIHFPEGAVPKDGPSAGITMTLAIISALTGIPVKHNIAMTGEITLRGRVMAIGGLREKTMAALRNGVETVLIPDDNMPDLKEIDPLVRKNLNFIPLKNLDDALPVAFTAPLPKPVVEFSKNILPELTAFKPGMDSHSIKQ